MSDEHNYEPYRYCQPQDDNSMDATEEAQFAEGDIVDEPVQEETVVVEPEQEPTKSFEESDSTYAYKFTTPSKPTYSVPQEAPKKKKGGFKKFMTTVALAVVFGVVASGVFLASNSALGKYFNIELKNGNKDVGTTQVATGTGTTTKSEVADVVDNVMPSVVSITNMSIQEVQNWFYGTTQYESESRGSGIIIGQNDSELLIVTNYHVVEGSKTLTVTFIDEANIEAQIKGTDSHRDLAIVSIPLSSIEKSTTEAIKIATLGDSDKLRVGEQTIAIGNALGYGQSVTSGIVSALGRTLEDYEGKLIQTDAAINEGNSGGALLNAKGEVIGINSAKLYGEKVESMGYAIPISDVVDILNELMNRETRTKVQEKDRGSLGIMGQTVSDMYMQAMGMSSGVLVTEIIEGSGADKAELPVNCIITEIDGIGINTMEELKEQLEYYKAGEKVVLTIDVPIRGGYAEEEIEVTLTKIEQ